MKSNKETLRRIVNYYRQTAMHPMTPFENRYSLPNVIRANSPTTNISLTRFFDRMSLLRDHEELGGYDSSKITQIIREANTSLEKQTPEHKKWAGALGYEDSSPYGDDFTKDLRKINVVNIFEAAKTIEEKANIAYLMGESTRVIRCVIDQRSTLGYYSVRPPNLPESVADSVLTYFSETGQLEKKLRLADRMKKYDVAAETVSQQKNKEGSNFAVAECLYLDGRVEEALDFYLKVAKHPMYVYGFLFKNAEMELAKKIAPTLIKKLEERNSSKDVYDFDSNKEDIEELKKIS